MEWGGFLTGIFLNMFIYGYTKEYPLNDNDLNNLFHITKNGQIYYQQVYNAWTLDNR